MTKEKLGKKKGSVTTNAPTLDELKEMGLPKKSVLLGFSVHHPIKDEFLAVWRENEGTSQWAWAKIPDLAMSFPSPKEAEVASRAYDSGIETIVCAVFDIGKKNAVWPMSSIFHAGLPFPHRGPLSPALQIQQ